MMIDRVLLARLSRRASSRPIASSRTRASSRPVVIVSLLLGVVLVCSQLLADWSGDPVEEIRSVYSSMSRSFEQSQRVHINYTVSVVMRDSTQSAPDDVDVDLICTPTSMMMRSSMAEVARDSTVSITVDHANCTVYITDVAHGDRASGSFDRILKQREMLLGTARAIAVVDSTTESGVDLRRARIEPGDSIRARHSMKYMDVTYDRQAQRLHAYRIVFVGTSSMAEMALRVNALDTADTSVSMPGSPLDLAFDGEGNLLERLRGYDVSDLRVGMSGE